MKTFMKAIKPFIITVAAALAMTTGISALDRDEAELVTHQCHCCCVHDKTAATYPKKDVPSLTLKVAESDDSALSEPIWQDCADYDFGDTVAMQLTSTIPDTFTTNNSSYIFNLQLPDGLTDASISVIIDDTILEQSSYTIHDTTDEGSIQIELNDITPSASITVDCSARLSGTAICGDDGNIVLAWLEYSTSADEPERTVTDKAVIFTHELDLTNANIPLGENLSLYKYFAAKGEYVMLGDIDTAVSNIIPGLDSGKYKLTSADRELEFELFAELDAESDDPKLTNLIVQFSDEHPTAPVINNNVELPFAGGRSAVLYYIAGAAMISAALLIVVLAKKRHNK